MFRKINSEFVIFLEKEQGHEERMGLDVVGILVAVFGQNRHGRSKASSHSYQVKILFLLARYEENSSPHRLFTNGL